MSSIYGNAPYRGIVKPPTRAVLRNGVPEHRSCAKALRGLTQRGDRVWQHQR